MEATPFENCPATPSTSAATNRVLFITSPNGVNFPPTPANLNRQLSSEDAMLQVHQRELAEQRSEFERRLVEQQNHHQRDLLSMKIVNQEHRNHSRNSPETSPIIAPPQTADPLLAYPQTADSLPAASRQS